MNYEKIQVQGILNIGEAMLQYWGRNLPRGAVCIVCSKSYGFMTCDVYV